MSNHFVAEGNTINYTPGGAIAAGEVVEISSVMLGIAHKPIAAGEAGTLGIKGIYSINKQAALAIDLGDEVYYDTTADEIDKTVTNQPCGICTKDALTGDTNVEFDLINGMWDQVPEA